MKNQESSDSSIDDDEQEEYLDDQEDPMTDQQTQNNNNQMSSTAGNTLPIKATGNAARSVIEKSSLYSHTKPRTHTPSLSLYM
jgi:hypothetical protein